MGNQFPVSGCECKARGTTVVCTHPLCLKLLIVALHLLPATHDTHRESARIKATLNSEVDADRSRALPASRSASTAAYGNTHASTAHASGTSSGRASAGVGATSERLSYVHQLFGLQLNPQGLQLLLRLEPPLLALHEASQLGEHEYKRSADGNAGLEA